MERAERRPAITTAGWEAEALRYAAPFGRALFSTIFILSGLKHFSHATIAYAASAGVPWASVLVPAAGVLAMLGGLSVLLGWRARIGAVMLILFLVPVTFMMHRFWEASNPMMAQVQYAAFLKNLSMIGGALLLLAFGAGPISVDASTSRRRRPNTIT